jgi:hypothetical protein
MTEEVLRRVERCPGSLPLGREGSLAEEQGRDRDDEAAAFDESCGLEYNRISSHRHFCLLVSPRRRAKMKVCLTSHRSGFPLEE